MIIAPRERRAGSPDSHRSIPAWFALTLLALALGACAEAPRLGAKPWDRGELAKRCMRLDGYALEAAIDDHIYFSKEASSGGAGFAGGGCGCN